MKKIMHLLLAAVICLFTSCGSFGEGILAGIGNIGGYGGYGSSYVAPSGAGSSGSSHSSSYGRSSSSGSSSSTSRGKTCHICHGTKKCWTCGGNRTYINPLTNKRIACPNCTNGWCSRCNGTGKL